MVGAQLGGSSEAREAEHQAVPHIKVTFSAIVCACTASWAHIRMKIGAAFADLCPTLHALALTLMAIPKPARFTSAMGHHGRAGLAVQLSFWGK
eukprot:11791377-Karenia_brevis.AAC.1